MPKAGAAGLLDEAGRLVVGGGPNNEVEAVVLLAAPVVPVVPVVAVVAVVVVVGTDPTGTFPPKLGAELAPVVKTGVVLEVAVVVLVVPVLGLEKSVGALVFPVDVVVVVVVPAIGFGLNSPPTPRLVLVLGAVPNSGDGAPVVLVVVGADLGGLLVVAAPVVPVVLFENNVPALPVVPKRFAPVVVVEGFPGAPPVVAPPKRLLVGGLVVVVPMMEGAPVVEEVSV